jgi:hypothetical protein
MTDAYTTADAYVAQASFAQQRMWFLEQLEDAAATYNTQVGFRFTGRLDREPLELAVADLIARHEALRTTFDVDDDGEVTQVIRPAAPLTLAVTDLCGRSDPELELARAGHADLHRAFDPAGGPLLRAHLFRLAAADHVLLVTLDHLVCDGWSVGILHRDLTAGYAARVLGTAPPPEPPVQYADFATWQRDWLQGPELERHLAYWRRTLADPPPPVAFPRTGGAAPGRRRVGTSDQTLPHRLVEELTGLGRGANVSLFVVLTTALAIQLSRYTGGTDLILGTPMANRTQAETDDVIGLFTNTVALRLDLSGEPALPELLARARTAVLDAHTMQHAPFDQVVGELAPDRAGHRSPLFNVLVEFTDVTREPVELPGLRIDPMPMVNLPIPMDLVVSLRREHGGLRAVWHHDSEQLTEEAVALMQRHFARLLGSMTENPRGLTGDLRMTAAAEAGNPRGLAGDPRTADVSAAPRPRGRTDTAVGRAAAAAWEEVLGHAGIGADDSFFELGGHSLAGARVMARLRRSLGLALPGRLLFDHPVFGDFVAALSDLVPETAR